MGVELTDMKLGFDDNFIDLVQTTSKIYLVDLNNSYTQLSPTFSTLFNTDNNNQLQLDNKYFTATLQLNTTTPSFNQEVEALVITINHQTKPADIEENLKRFEDSKLKIVCYEDDKITHEDKLALLTPTLKYDGELIDFSDLDDDETAGDLLIASFSAISWSTAKLKKPKVSNRKGEVKGECIGRSEVEDMEALFASFSSSKNTADGLSGQDRYDYAEKVVEQFWNVLNLSEDEQE